MDGFLVVWRNKRQDRIIPEVAVVGQRNRHTLQAGAYTYGPCNAFSRELRRVIWPVKFKLDLPPRYDGRNNSLEFLQLYTVAV